jgi:hypothetical protein
VKDFNFLENINCLYTNADQLRNKLDELRARYRFGQNSINFIANLLREDLVRTTNMATGLTVDEQVKIALRHHQSGHFEI